MARFREEIGVNMYLTNGYRLDTNVDVEAFVLFETALFLYRPRFAAVRVIK